MKLTRLFQPRNPRFWLLLVLNLLSAGLAWGMRLALRSTQPTMLLLLSAALRLAALLGVGYWVSAAASKAWPLAGYALAFFLVRVLAVARARRVPNPGSSAAPEQGGA